MTRDREGRREAPQGQERGERADKNPSFHDANRPYEQILREHESPMLGSVYGAVYRASSVAKRAADAPRRVKIVGVALGKGDISIWEPIGVLVERPAS